MTGFTHIKIMRLSQICLGLLLMALGVKGNTVIQPDCVMPTNEVGKCVDVRFCVSIMTALINNDHLTNPTVGNYLRRSQCGILRNSHRVCCGVHDIDFGNDTDAPSHVESSTTKLATNLQPPTIAKLSRLSDIETCGKLDVSETPLKWIAEVWFQVESSLKTQLETRCLGTLISHKHLVVPAHCVANLPENISLDFVEIQGHEFSASKIFIHASYNQPKFSNDIAIIELDKADDGNEINDAVCLPESRSTGYTLKSTIAVVKRAGGSLKFGKSLFNANNECSSYFNQQFTDLTPGQFCANVQSNETIYSPFIGAIAMESDQKRQYSLKGFTSTAIRTGQAFDESKPYIFTDIFHHLSWIQAAIGDEVNNNRQQAAVDSTTQALRPCESSNGNGFCVKLDQCSIYRDAPKPITRRRQGLLNEIKCFTAAEVRGNRVDEDGICCSKQYIELGNTVQYDVDQRFRGKQGVDALDMIKCGQVDPTRRIVGGTKADMKEFPWIGLIKYKTGRIFKFTCGSSLISSKHLLTAAHCITNLPSSYEVIAVRLGEYDRRTNPDCRVVDENQEDCNAPIQDILVEKLIPHPKYNTPRYANDVGLIRLAEAPDGIVPICLPINQEMQQSISNKYTVAGFGFTENGRDSDVLLKVVLPKVPKETCQSFHSSMIQLSEGQECYGGEGIQDSCKGDSGNPLMNYINVKGRIKAVQLGIVAAGSADCGRGANGFPGIYSDINHYLEWILDQVEE